MAGKQDQLCFFSELKKAVAIHLNRNVCARSLTHNTLTRSISSGFDICHSVTATLSHRLNLRKLNRFKQDTAKLTVKLVYNVVNALNANYIPINVNYT